MTEEAGKQEETKSEEKKSSDLTQFSSESRLAGDFVQQIGQALIQWMPVGGSGAVFLTFLLQQNWLMAIVIFPVTVITVFWATFTGGLLSKIQEIAKSMGEESGTFLGKWLRAILEGILWQLIRTEVNYLKCQGLEVSQSKTEGLSTFKPSLKDVFIPLELSGEFWRSPDGHNLPMPMGFHSVQEVSDFLEKSNEFRIWDILRGCPRNSGDRSIVIQAWGGYGKTTLLRHVTYIYCHQLYRKAPYSTRQSKVPKLLPVLLPFRQWQETIYNEKSDLPTLIEKFHIPSLPGGNDLSFRRDWWAKYWLNQKSGMLIMFDGFDEVKEERRAFISQWIGQQIQKFPNAVFIVTSRPTAYRLHFDSESKLSLPFWVKPLNKEQQESFIQRWYLSYEKYISVRTEHPQVITTEANRNTQELLKQLQERPELNDLAKNPLMLAIMVNLHASYRGANLPDRRVDLYRDIIRLQLGDRPLAKKIDLLLPLQESQRVLQKLALFMVLESRYAIDHNSLLQQLQKILDQYNLSVNNQAFLQQMEEVSELLVKVDRDYEFAHRHFQSYLAVCEIIETKQENLLLTNWSDTEWKETLMMYASLAYSTQLISDLLTLKQQAATDLAYECLQCLKAANRRIDPALEQAMTTLQSTVENSLYQQLESYLKNSQWREADKETDRLMLQIVGKEATGRWLSADQWFSIEDIENFPCKHLRAIDKLWVDYSQGKFGFSVQKKVWMDCGGVPGKSDCDLYDWDVYKKFADQVGWVRSGNYVSHNLLLEDSKHAHLPSRFGYVPNNLRSRWGRRDLGGQAGFWKIFFYRVATCNL
jgi:predicted NACHT family NTPase